MTLKANADLLESRTDEIGARVSKIDKLMLTARGVELDSLTRERAALMAEWRGIVKRGSR